MKYLINQSICFDALDGSLSQTSGAEATEQLSKPGVRLLNELVKHGGITLSRERLLERVWERHGLIPSNNNLSNHISFLRKTFANMGESKEIIVTVPKAGFRLEAQIQPLAFPEQQDNLLPQKPVSHDRRRRKVKKLNIFPRLVFVLIAIVVLLIMGFTIRSAINTLVYYKVSASKKTVGSCLLIDIGAGSKISNNEKISIMQDLVREMNFDCTQRKEIYFNIMNYPAHRKHDKYVVFLAQCSAKRAYRVPHCNNYRSITIKKP